MCLDAGADLIMVESEGITENVARGQWRTDVISTFMDEMGPDMVSKSVSKYCFVRYGTMHNALVGCGCLLLHYHIGKRGSK